MVTGEREVDTVDEGKLSVGYVLVQSEEGWKLMVGAAELTLERPSLESRTARID